MSSRCMRVSTEDPQLVSVTAVSNAGQRKEARRRFFCCFDPFTRKRRILQRGEGWRKKEKRGNDLDALPGSEGRLPLGRLQRCRWIQYLCTKNHAFNMKQTISKLKILVNLFHFINPNQTYDICLKNG
ncbi:hypothetical protein CEXT_695071 [Caerostris extrusa]|uniref:Uncharacterized protein n=1 Tax=Caerostris extrusa TaxID=172846 RepID=A0AAV4X6X8_CAEEX|nr:hypothetical protein CEXT_695071 [Caerostris extrusa]